MPLRAAGDWGSGRWSMTENRNASGQLVKEVIFEGDSVLGSSSSVRTRAIEPRLRRGWVKGPDDRIGHNAWMLEGPEMSKPGENLHPRGSETVRQQPEGGRGEVFAL